MEHKATAYQEPMSDGSKAWNVRLTLAADTEVILACTDQEHAADLESLLEQCAWASTSRPTDQEEYERASELEPAVEFSETPDGDEARDRWARHYDELNGAPEGDWDR